VFRFTRAGNVHASPADIENAAASAIAGVSPGGTFITLATEQGLEHLLVTNDNPGQQSVAFAVARAIAATSTEVDEVPELTARNVAVLEAIPNAEPLQDTQSGADFTALSKIIGDLLMPGEWFAVSVRKPRARTEIPRNRTWLDFYGMRTHHSRKTGAVVAQFFAGTEHGRARAGDIVMRISTAIPGFGLATRARPISTARQIGVLTVAAVVAALLGIVAPGLHSAVPGWVPAVGIGLAVMLLGAALLTWRERFPSRASHVHAALVWGRVPIAPVRLRRPRPPRKAGVQRKTVGRDEQGVPIVREEDIAEFRGDYPLALSAFLLGPHIPLAIVAPHAGTASGSTATAKRDAPPAMLERIGPRLGESEGKMAHLSVADAWSGVGLIGQAGSGKTALMEHLWGAACKERVSPSGIAGTPSRHALIAFDTKGDGMASIEYEKWSHHSGDKALTIQVFDPTSVYGIELFADRGEGVMVWARGVVDAMRYIWGEDSIGAQSFDTLTRVMAASKKVTPEIAARVQRSPLAAGASPFYYANILLTNDGDDLGQELYAALAEAAARDGATDEELSLVVSALSPVYGPGRTPAQRQQLVSAPRTKVAALMAAEHWWSRPKRLPWSTALEHDLAVIVNTGTSPSGHLPDDKLRTDISGLMLYTLHEEIKRTCRGWFEQGRAVSIFSDEVKHIAESSADVIAWMRNDARANGVRPVFATQTPDTLVDAVRRTMLGFGTLVLFAQNEPKTAAEIVSDLSLAGGEWATADVVNLDRFEAIVRATVSGKRMEPFTLRVPNFRDEREHGTWVA